MRISPPDTRHLGDFCNMLPVISGLARSRSTRAALVLNPHMRKFKGLRDLLLLQPDIETVAFDDYPPADAISIRRGPWREQSDSALPAFTCRFENWVRHVHKLDFEVNVAFELVVPDQVDVEIKDRCYAGDRAAPNAQKPNMGIPGLDCEYLDYSVDLIRNAYIVKHAPRLFVSCFTGISIIADLVNHPNNIVSWRQQDFAPELWDGDNINFSGKPIEGMFLDHYYQDRGSMLLHYDTLPALIEAAMAESASEVSQWSPSSKSTSKTNSPSKAGSQSVVPTRRRRR